MPTIPGVTGQPILVAGHWVTSSDALVVENPARPGEVAGSTYLATEAQLEEATAGAVRAFERTRRLPAYERSAALRTIAGGISNDRERLARLIVAEAGKPLRDALTEVDRAAFTFRVGAEEAERIGGSTIPLDLNAGGKGRTGITARFPVGPVAAISPFNFPLNLAAHKLAPAIAAGCSVVLKPPSKAPLTILAVGDLIERAGLPEGTVSILPMTRELGDRMVADPRFRLLTFTGSPDVGWGLKARAGKKRVVLELGGNAGVVIDRSADIDWAINRTVLGAFSYAGQACISVQRIFVHDEVYSTFVDGFLSRAASLQLGDPLDPATDLGPMIDPTAASRIHDWIQEAVAAGASVRLGGNRDGAFMEPTVLEGAPRMARVCSQEAFAPLVVISRFRDFADAISAVNDSAFGLQAGIFTNDLANGWAAFQELEVGGVILNDVPTYRIDHMPYGGVKDSGLGREGLRWAVEDMTELRLLVLGASGPGAR